jgi:hypothetical protein
VIGESLRTKSFQSRWFRRLTATIFAFTPCLTAIDTPAGMKMETSAAPLAKASIAVEPPL